MATTDVDLDTALKALRLLDELVEQQWEKVRALARRIHPGLTDADLRDVREFRDVHGDPAFQFEEGQLAGLVAAQLGLKGRLLGGALPT